MQNAPLTFAKDAFRLRTTRDCGPYGNQNLKRMPMVA
jgi:hypothetical protein